MTSTTDTITLGGGCFWCLEAVYERVRGVLSVESGYANGQVVNPSYEQVCSGTTGHAEVVRVRFDPAQITLREVLEIFFVIHDPTTLNRQGDDTRHAVPLRHLFPRRRRRKRSRARCWPRSTRCTGAAS